jgi:transmembrane sensor
MINLRKAWRWSLEWPARQRARHWVLRFELSDVNPISESERASFDRWFASDVRHQELFRECWTAHAYMSAAVWELRESLPERPIPTASRVLARWIPYGAVAAVVLATAGLALRFLSVDTHMYETRSGEVRHVRLPDGSELQLGTRTRVQWERCPDLRCVRLLGGEAYFSVRKDKTHPFVVRVNGATIRVTGTEFDVRQSQRQVSVTVAEGTVSILGSSWSRDLHANEQLTFDSQRIVADAHPTVASTTSSWRHGALDIDDSVPAAVCRLSEYIDAPVKYDPRVSDYDIHGRLDLSNVPQTLMKLPAPAPIIVERIGDSYVVHLRTRAVSVATDRDLVRCPY